MRRFIEFYDIMNKVVVFVDIDMIYMIEKPVVNIRKTYKGNSKIYLNTSNIKNCIMVKDTAEEIMKIIEDTPFTQIKEEST